MLIRATVLVGLTLALAACGSGAKPTPSPTAQPSPTLATSSSPTAPSTASEAGETPIFWRTVDGFASLEAGVGYKVVFRVTNGYAEPALPITAAPEGGGVSEHFEAQQVQAGAGEGPGSFYAVNITLPTFGKWQLTVLAGNDRATIPVEVRIATPAG